MNGFEKLRRSRRNLHFILDFDGTLIPIRKARENTKFPKSTLHALEALRDFPVTILSGRRDEELKPAFKEFRFKLVGRGGLVETKALTKTGDDIRERLSDLLARTDLRDAYIEEKGALTALHFRGLKARSISASMLKAAREAISSLTLTSHWHAYLGKKVVNIEPLSVSKANFVRGYLKKHPKARVVFAGDDRNDFPVFEISHPRLVQFYMGANSSRRKSWAPSVTAIPRARFLSLLTTLKSPVD